MVDWQNREGSTNVEHRRGGAGTAGISGIAVLILRFVLTRWGLGGVAVLAAGFFALSAIGINPLALISGGSAGGSSAPPTEARLQAEKFSDVVLRETEVVWTNYFAQHGETYPEPKMVTFEGQDQSGCGTASAAVGPFYCPLDRTVYLDTDFFNELSKRFGAPGDFAAAYVIAHEVGHHVQTITGISDKVRAAQERTNQAGANALQVKMELQADCYAGVWAHEAERTRSFIQEGDIEEGLRAASAIGDDTLQRNAGRRVTPESFTHGSSEQRKDWFYRGYKSGDPTACDTFNS